MLKILKEKRSSLDEDLWV